MPRINKVGHVVLNVKDVETSVKFYTEALGMEVMRLRESSAAFLSFGTQHHDIALFKAHLIHPLAVGHLSARRFVHGGAIFRASLMRKSRAADQTMSRIVLMIERGKQAPLGAAFVNGIVLNQFVCDKLFDSRSNPISVFRRLHRERVDAARTRIK